MDYKAIMDDPFLAAIVVGVTGAVGVGLMAIWKALTALIVRALNQVAPDHVGDERALALTQYHGITLASYHRALVAGQFGEGRMEVGKRDKLLDASAGLGDTSRPAHHRRDAVGALEAGNALGKEPVITAVVSVV